MRKTYKSRREGVGRAKRGFKGKAAALLVSAALGLPACGDTINHNYYVTDGGAPSVNVEPPEVNVDVPDVTVNMPSESTEVSPLCADDVEVAFEATLNTGEALLLRNGLRLELRDMEDSTQTAFFHLTDDDGVTLEHVDMVEGVEGTIDLGDGPVAIVACSVRIGYQFNERSVTVRAESNISREEATCEDETWLSETRVLENGATQEVRQYVQRDNCEEELPITVLSEITELEPGFETGEGREGLAVNERLTVSLCNETYTILDVSSEGIDFGKEAVAFGMRPDADAVITPDVTLRMEGVEDHDGVDHVVVSVLDSFGEVATRFHFAAGESITLVIEGEPYTFHAYTVTPQDGEVPASALMALISESVAMREGTSTELPCGDYVAGNYSFSMSWDGDAVAGWTLTRE